MAPPCPPFREPNEHPNEEAYFDHLTDLMAWFHLWGYSGTQHLQAVIPPSDTARVERAHRMALMQFNQDPIVGNGALPSTPEHCRAYFERCKEMSTRPMRNAVDAVIRVNYAMAYIQILLVQLDGRHPGDMDILLRILNTAKQKSAIICLDDVDPSLTVAQGNLIKLLDRLGEKFTYWDDALQEVIECEIANGGGDVIGEEWFAINKTTGGQTDDDVVTAKQLEALLSCQI
ncbi:unnamed protein product [Somion occarium]|uniref:Uncharacterized protein n=1 Tax=Somion occarium TaxID=3059160 RepID=A0ABP1DBT9_9APHY